MHSCHPTRDDLRRSKRRQTFQPQTRRFRLTMTILPRMHDLVRTTIPRAHNRNRILKADARDRSRSQLLEKIQRLTLLFVPLRKPSRTTHRQIRARRMGNQQIPAEAEDMSHITHKMLSGALTWQQIATPRIMSQRCKGIPDNPGKFARHEYSHHAISRRMNSYLWLTKETNSLPTMRDQRHPRSASEKGRRRPVQRRKNPRTKARTG